MTFKGFSPKTLQFFERLAMNNDKAWFEEHRAEYEEYVKQPSVEFVKSMGDVLPILDPGIHAIPKVNKSLFKIYRDTRFSKNKLPLKDHVGILFWSGMRKRMECSGFYLHLEGDKFYLGSGIYMFSKDLLGLYRKAIQAGGRTDRLFDILEQLKSMGYVIGGSTLKKVPRGMDPDMLHPELSLYKGLHVGVEVEADPILFSDDLLTFAFDHYKTLLPLHEWLKETFD